MSNSNSAHKNKEIVKGCHLIIFGFVCILLQCGCGLLKGFYDLKLGIVFDYLSKICRDVSVFLVLSDV